MNRIQQCVAVVLFAAAVLIGWYSLGELRFYTRLGPGPGFFPVWLATAMGLLSAWLFYEAAKAEPVPVPADFFPSPQGAARIALILLALLATAFLIEPLGFRLTLLAFYVCVLRGLGVKGLFTTLAIAISGSFGVFHVFTRLLNIPLPVGSFGI